MRKSKYVTIDPLPGARNRAQQKTPTLSQETKSAHRLLRTPLWRYLHRSEFLVVLTAPLIYSLLLPFLLLDGFISIYQAVCFPIYGIPKVQRKPYFVFDRGQLLYLNLLERLNCAYCSYANGLIAYVTEIAGRTEQHWCPIKHAREAAAHHDRYEYFLPYGDAEKFRAQHEEVQCDFKDLAG